MTVPKQGDRFVSNLTGHSMEVKSVTKKEITVEVERRVTSRSTGEIKTEKRTRVVQLQLWGLCCSSYRREA